MTDITYTCTAKFDEECDTAPATREAGAEWHPETQTWELTDTYMVESIYCPNCGGNITKVELATGEPVVD